MQVSKNVCVCRQDERCSIGIYTANADYRISTFILSVFVDVISRYFYKLRDKFNVQDKSLTSLNRMNYLDCDKPSIDFFAQKFEVLIRNGSERLCGGGFV